VRAPGHRLDVDRLVEVLDQPGEQRLQGRRVGCLGQRSLDVLRLATVAVRGHDHPAGELGGRLGAVDQPHEV
jgi:hypothetical protein